MLPAGNYHGPVLGGALTTSENGNPQVEIRFNALMYWNAVANAWEQVPPAPGTNITERTLYLSCTDAAWEYTEAKLRTLGFNGDFKAPDFSDDVKGEGVGFTLAIENYKNKPKEKWELTKWGTRKENAPAGADVVRSLSARWTQAGMATRTNGALNPNTRPAGRPTAPPARNGAGANGQTASASSAPSAPRSAPPAASVAPGSAAAAETSNGGLAAIAEPITTKEAAWEAFCEACGGDPDLTKWATTLAQVGDETAFGPDEWSRVGQLVDAIGRF